MGPPAIRPVTLGHCYARRQPDTLKGRLVTRQPRPPCAFLGIPTTLRLAEAHNQITAAFTCPGRLQGT